MKFHKITSVFYYIISAIVFYSLLELSIPYSFQIHIVFFSLPPFVAIFLLSIFCIWLVMTITKLIKKSFISFSAGKIAQGIGLLLAGILLLVFMFFVFIVGVSMF